MGTLPETKYHAKDDTEYLAIKVGGGNIYAQMKQKELGNIHLPLNNPEAYQYLRWLNHYFHDNNNYLNFILNTWDFSILDGEKPVRPPSIRELAIVQSRDIARIDDENQPPYKLDMGWAIDTHAEIISDAYYYNSYSKWISSGLAGCLLKWGTFEDNLKEGDEFITYEESEKESREKMEGGKKDE